MNKLLSLVLLSSTCIGAKLQSQDEKSFYLKQVDYRVRASTSYSIPGISRLRLRASYEYRYEIKSKEEVSRPKPD